VAGDIPLAFSDPGPLLGPGDDVIARAGDRWALAVAAVLGGGGRDVPEEHAPRLVAGYAIAGRWLSDAANADGTPAVQLGPWLVTTDDAGAERTVRAARVVVDDVAVAAGAWAVGAGFARIIARASRQFELRPGDVLTTLVPAADGGPCAAPLTAGQRVRLEVDGLGALPATAV
jgi:2-keto-4-pentenoate hydratase/2-oxohepta-3-ene-1,7-dioic acid hydratase in catechol pathway